MGRLKITLLDRGTWFANAKYAHAFTVKATGYALILQGAHPERISIIGNEWRNPETDAPSYNTLIYSHVAEHLLGMPR